MTGSLLPDSVICINNAHHTVHLPRVLNGLSRLGANWRRAMFGVLLALACGEPTGPEQPVAGTVRIRSVFAEGESAQALRLTVDSIHVVLTRTGAAAPVVDMRSAFVDGAALSWVIELVSSSEPISARVELTGDGQLLYTATAVLSAAVGTTGEIEAREIVVRYVGPPRAMSIAFSPDLVRLTARGETKEIGATPLNRAGQPIPGKAFTWRSSRPNVASVDAVGRVTAIDEGIAEVTATVDGLDRVATVVVAVTAAPERSTIDASPASQPADGESPAHVIVTLIDANGNPTGASGGPLTLTTTRGVLTAVVDRGDGTYTASLTSAVDGTATVRGELDGTPLADSATVLFTRLPSVATTLDVSPSGTTLAALGAVQAYAGVVRDQYGDPMPGAALQWMSSAPSVASIDPTSGVATAVSNGSASITATVVGSAGLSASASLTVAVVAAPEMTTLVATPASVVADGSTPASVTLRLFDARGHALTASGGVVALRTSLGALSAIVDRGDGSYTATLSGGTPGHAVLSATVNGAAVPMQASVEFTPVSRVLTSVVILPANQRLTALGATRALSAVARDQFGATMSGVTFTWASSTPTVSVDAATGVVTAVTNGDATITATAAGAPGISASVVLTVAQVASASLSTVTATPASVRADGASPATVRVALLDSLGQALRASGGTVGLSTDRGTLSGVTDHADGTYTATITHATPGVATITATLDGVALAAHAAVTFTRLPAVLTTIDVSPATATLDALGASVGFTAVARDQYGEAMPDAVLTWTTSAPAIATISANSGVATAVAAGTATITARSAGAPGVVGSAALTVQPVADPARATLTSSPDALTADGTSAATVTVRLFDPRGNALGRSGGALALHATLGTLSPVTDHQDGSYTATLTSVTAGSSVVSGTLGGIALGDSSVVVFTPIVLVATTIEVAPSSSTFAALGATRAFSAVVRDQFGAVMAGAPVVWTSRAPAVASVEANTGIATSVANGTTGLIARVDGIADTATLTVAQVASAAQSTLSASLTSIPADSATATTIRVALIDSLGHALTASGGTVALITSHGVLSAVTDHADGSYSATLTGTSAGVASISASIDGRALTAEVSVQVTRLPSVLMSLEVSPAQTTLTALGATVGLTAVARDQYGDVMPGVTLAWTSDAPAVTVDAASGLVTAVANGSATVTASVAGVSARATLTVAQAASAAHSSLSAAPASVTADGSPIAVLVTLRDARSNRLTASGGTVALAASRGTLTPVTDHGDGTYSATLSSAVAGPSVVSGTLSGIAIADTATVVFDPIILVPTSVEVSSSAATLDALGATSVHTAIVRDQFGAIMPGAGVSWASSDPAVATIDGAGVATAVSNGTTSITASVTAAPGIDASVALSVAQAASAASSTLIAGPDSIIADGATASTLTLTLRDRLGQRLTTGGGAVAFESSIGALSAVTDRGDGSYTVTLTSTVIGRATVSATLDGAAIAAPAAVEVRRIPPVVASIVIAPAAPVLHALGATHAFSAIAYEADGQPIPGTPLAWTSSAATVATVSANGLVTAVGNGTATITVTAPNGATATAPIVVQQRAATVQLQATCTRGAPECVRDAFGETVSLAAVVRDSLDHVIAGATVVFASSNTAIAIVNAAGTVTAVGNGSAIISATVDGVAAQYTVSILQRVTSIHMNPPELWLTGVGSSGNITATPRDRNNNLVADVEVTWSPGDTAIAPYEVTGPRTVHVTARQLGESRVYAHAAGLTAKVIVRIR